MQHPQIRCHPFSDALYPGPQRCCNSMALVPAVTHSLKCHTCILRKDVPAGVIPLLPADKCAEEHFANNHVISCLICASYIFPPQTSQTKTTLHVSECIARATYNSSRPYVCTSCFRTLWFK